MKKVEEEKKKVRKLEKEAKDAKKEAKSLKNEAKAQAAAALVVSNGPIKAYKKSDGHVFSGKCPGSGQKSPGASTLHECAKLASDASFEFASFSADADVCIFFKTCDQSSCEKKGEFKTMALMWTEAPTERALSKKILESAKDDVDFDKAQEKLFSQWRDSSR